jgi:hypothetical protein
MRVIGRRFELPHTSTLLVERGVTTTADPSQRRVTVGVGRAVECATIDPSTIAVDSGRARGVERDRARGRVA